jgi:hypothetical protein
VVPLRIKNLIRYRVARQPCAAQPFQNRARKFPFTRLKPFANASGRETRRRYGNTQAMNPVMAFWMKQNAVCGTA